MKNFILKMFDFLKNSVKFFEIVIIFFAMLMILYWIQHLIGADWSLFKIFVPVLDSIIFIVNYIALVMSIDLDKFVQFKYVGSLASSSSR